MKNFLLTQKDPSVREVQSQNQKSPVLRRAEKKIQSQSSQKIQKEIKMRNKLQQEESEESALTQKVQKQRAKILRRSLRLINTLNII